MQPEPSPIYANVVSVRASTNEVIMDFGAFFPEAGTDTTSGKRIDFVPTVRVVIVAQAARTLADMLINAAKAAQEASNKVRVDDPTATTPKAVRG